MALLTDLDRKVIWSKYMSDLSSRRESIILNKGELRSVVDAVDQWIDDNQASFNSSLPVVAQTGLTAKQKAALLMYVINKRYEVI